MSFTAAWSILQTKGTVLGSEMTIHTPDDIDTLIRQLGQAGSTAALIQHRNRPTVSDEDLGEVPDHDMTVGIWQGFGYMTFTDAEYEYSHLVGESNSPRFEGDYAEYPAGSGIIPTALRPALIEFLETAKRPTNVVWLDAS